MPKLISSAAAYMWQMRIWLNSMPSEEHSMQLKPNDAISLSIFRAKAASGWITEQKMVELAQPMIKNQYGQYLLKVVDELKHKRKEVKR